MIIAGTGRALPEPRSLSQTEHPDPRQIEALRLAGYKKYPVSDTSARALGGQAARAALDDAGIDPASLAFIVAGQSNVPDYIGIDFACQVGAELGGLTLRTLNIVEGCSSGVSAWFWAEHMARDLAPGEAGLIVLCQKVSQAHQDRFGLMNAVLSDGAAAAVVTRDDAAKASGSDTVRLRYIGGSEISRSGYVDMMRLERGGGLNPEVRTDHDTRTDPLGRDRIAELYDFESDGLFAFLDERLNRTLDLIRTTLADHGRSIDERLLLLHSLEGRSAMTSIAQELGIDLGRTNLDLLEHLGHMGCVDPLISLDMKLTSKDIGSGDPVMLSSIATGMKWCCALFEAV